MDTSTITSGLTNRRFVLASRPHGEPVPGNFRLEEAPVPEPGPGELVVRTIWLSLAPYMRWRMGEEKSYAPPVALGDVMVGATIGEVVASDNAAYQAGALVLGGNGWQEYAISNGAGLRLVDPAAGPPSALLGVLGLNGMTAYSGLLNIGRPKPGETVVVAAASGGVGAVVGQIAKIKGARAVGIAGGAAKCAYVKDELGFDACLDHRSPIFAAELASACPAGIDVYFENVGGLVWDAVLPLLNDYARVPVCGVISQYSATEPPPGPDKMAGMMSLVLRKRLLIHGFLVSDFMADQANFAKDIGAWVQEGRIRSREDIVEGLANAPEAFIGMLQGRNFGKVVVRVSQ